MTSLRVAPEDSDSLRKRNKLVRRQSTKRWWLSDEAKEKMKTEFDSLVEITERDHQGVGCMLFWNQDHGVINPHSNLIVSWDILMLVLILVISFTTPYETGFLDVDEDSGFFYLNTNMIQYFSLLHNKHHLTIASMRTLSAEGLSSATDIPLGHAIHIVRSLKTYPKTSSEVEGDIDEFVHHKDGAASSSIRFRKRESSSLEKHKMKNRSSNRTTSDESSAVAVDY